MNQGMANSPHSDEDYAAFVGKNVQKFLSKFTGFRMDPGGFHASWNWAAFFFSFWWFLYRKMYMWAVICFITFWLPYFNLIVWIAWGVAANGLYFKHANEKISEVKMYQGDRYGVFLSDAGGVNGWVPWVALLVSGGFFMLFALLGLLGFAFLSTVWLPFPDVTFFTDPPMEILFRLSF